MQIDCVKGITRAEIFKVKDWYLQPGCLEAGPRGIWFFFFLFYFFPPFIKPITHLQSPLMQLSCVCSLPSGERHLLTEAVGWNGVYVTALWVWSQHNVLSAMPCSFTSPTGVSNKVKRGLNVRGKITQLRAFTCDSESGGFETALAG